MSTVLTDENISGHELARFAYTCSNRIRSRGPKQLYLLIGPALIGMDV
jgi:hypothetical protein